MRFSPQILILLVTLGSSRAAEVQLLSYNRDIRPILSENCFYCHGQDENKRKKDLQLNIQAGQRANEVVVPGQPEASKLIQRLFSTDSEEVMPPSKSNRHVSDQEREMLKRWIAEGAVFEEHWTYQAPKQPAIPEVPNFAIRNPIDAFVAQKLSAKGLPFSPEADKVTLLRRLHADLIGLPPTPEEVDTFLADTSPDAYDKAVERLLASPHYGERMALPWLDAARFADSNGFQQDGDTHQYIWRDWVVKALNADMPFDQFSTEQLAGDLLPNPTQDQLIATAFNRNHLLNGEGGAIAEEQRNVILFDRVDTTATTWLGLTMACAQCHDHKYDPITQRDYYSMMAMFNNVPESGVPSGGGQYRIADPAITVGTDEDNARLKTLETSLAAAREAEQNLAQSPETLAAYQAMEKDLAPDTDVTWISLKPETANATGDVQLHVMDDFSIFADGPRPDKADYTITLPPSIPGLTGFRIETIPDDRLPSKGAGRSDSGNAVLTRLKFTAGGREIKFNAAAATYTQSGFSPAGVIDEDVNTAWAFYPETAKSYSLTVQTPEAVTLAANEKIVLTFEFQSPHNQHMLGRFRILGTSGAQPVSRGAFPGEISAILKKSERSNDEAAKLREFLVKDHPPAAVAAARALAKSAETALNDLRNNLPRVMVMSDKQPRQTKILDRGNYLNPKEDVTAGTPAFLPTLPEGAPKNRLGLAQWLFRPDHPLTARVQANRIWQYFFSTGLVKTSEDLGVQSEMPIHGALLDWLAVEFREHGWSQKHLVRLILNSTTYRQSSRITPDLLQKDPENRLISRASRFRMPSMILRDLALSVSGLLNPKMGGKPVYPYQPSEVWETLAITKERDFTYPASSGPDLYRRSLYTFWRRTIGPTNLFDASARQACKVRSSLTSTPLHALTTLNDITWVEASRVLAEHAMQQNPDRSAQIRWAFSKILARAPTERDLAKLQPAYEKQLAIFSADPAGAAAFVAVGSAPKSSLPAVDHAALSAVCLLLFNLDESLTRQ